ncbi:MAG: hypothetical protein QOI60_1212 [Actinomycetota bacterium]|jgi:polyhydroxyalkanoate synthesis regulator phasin|nr:hypothetical protein [Actinomycetota bacterium]
MLDDLRKTIEATIGELTPARARSLAKNLAGPGAAKDQVAKSAADILDWSQKNRERLKEFVRREVSSQVGAVGIATQNELETLKKRVRALERAADKRASASGKTAAKRTTTGAKAARTPASKATSSASGKKAADTPARG